jgi:hypothetical protein
MIGRCIEFIVVDIAMFFFDFSFVEISSLFEQQIDCVFFSIPLSESMYIV